MLKSACDMPAHGADWRLLLCSLACMMLGCAKAPARAPSQPVPITGKVTLDGQPLPDAEVIFKTQTLGTFAAATDANGVYKLVSSVGGEQVCEGPCAVTISKFVLPAGQTPQPDMSPELQGGKQLLPSKYSDSNETKLGVNVPKEGGTFDFSLDSK